MEYLFSPIDHYMELIATPIGQHPSAICLLLSYFLSMPLALGFRIKFINRHMYSIISGGLLQLFVFREGCIHFLIMILITKILMHVLDRKKQPWIIFIFAFTYSSICCIVDYFYRYRSPEVVYSYYSNIICLKLATLGFCYKDSVVEESKLSEHRKQCKISKVPSLIEMISYSCYPGCCIIGPFFEFKDYINFIEKKEQYADIPLSFFKGVFKYVQATLAMGLAVLILQNINIDFFGTDEYNKSSLLYKLVYAFMITYQFKYKGFSVWFFADGANILSGLSYSGYDNSGKPLYETVVSVKYLDCEFGSSPREIISAWNNQTGLWLRYYVYERIKKNKKENEEKASFITFMVSAFWHGFYPGYYLFFVCVFMVLSISKKVYKCKAYFKWIPEYLVWPLSFGIFWIFMVQISLNKNKIIFNKNVK